MRHLSAVLVLVLAACAGSDADEAPAIVLQDSAGVEIIDNTAPAWAAGGEWRIAGEPMVDIGMEEGPPHYAFGYAHNPVRLRDGTIVVGDMQTNMMHFYDPSGQWLRSAGRSGQGPGEFEQLYRLRKIAGDSLLALNPASLTSVFTSLGEYVRRFDLAPVPGRGNLWWVAPLSNGTLVSFSLQREGTVTRMSDDGVHEARYEIPEKPPFYRDSLLYMLFTMEGELIDSIAKLPGQFLGEERVYAPNAAHAFLGDVFYHSPGDRIEIRALRSLGRQAQVVSEGVAQPPMRLERIIRSVPPRDIRMTEELKERHFEAERGRYRSMRESAMRTIDEAALNRRLEATPFPPTIPAHGNRMYADPLGNLWLQEYALDPEAAHRWLVFDADGRWLGAVETPARFTLSEVGEDYVLGIWSDSLDVQHVRMHRIEKPARR